jgi:hypothetical protein
MSGSSSIAMEEPRGGCGSFSDVVTSENAGCIVIDGFGGVKRRRTRWARHLK